MADRMHWDHELRMKYELNPEVMSDRNFAETLKKTQEFAKVKNAFFVYKKFPNHKMADFIIARDD